MNEFVINSFSNLPIMVSFKQLGPALIIFVLLIILVNFFKKSFKKSLRKLRTKGKENKLPDSLGNSWETNIAELKDISKDKENYLYLQPWYMVLGLTNSGKSSLFINSELPTMNKSEPNRREVKATTDCDFWMFDKMIILDMAGRLVNKEKADNNDWQQLIRMLKKTKGENALQGIIVVKDAKELIEEGNRGLGQEAIDLKERIENLSNELKLKLPVYVIVNKMDTISSFEILFKALTSEQKNLMGGPIESGSWKSGFNDLTKLLKAKLLTLRTQQLYKQGRKAVELLRTKRDFEKLTQGLEKFLTQLIESNAYRDQGQLRGLFFTSGMYKQSNGRSGQLFVKDIFKSLQGEVESIPTGFKLVTIKNIILTILLITASIFSITALNSVKKIGCHLTSLQQSENIGEAYEEAKAISDITRKLPLQLFIPTKSIANKKNELYRKKYKNKFENKNSKTAEYNYFFISYCSDSLLDRLEETYEGNKYIEYYIKNLDRAERKKSVTERVAVIKDIGLRSTQFEDLYDELAKIVSSKAKKIRFAFEEEIEKLEMEALEN